MKTIKITALLIALLLFFSGTSFAQKREIADTNYFDRVQKYISWMKETVDKMSRELESGRNDKDLLKIECIEKRLVDIQKLLAEIQAGYKKMREFSFNKKIPALRQEFTLIDQKRKIVEQLIKLVNDCLGKTFHDGFTETVEEFFGIYDDLDPTLHGWEEYWPEPLPPIYEPRPASLADEE